MGRAEAQGEGQARRTRIIIVRLDPTSVNFSLDPALSRHQNWTINSVERSRAAALEAFQSYPMLLHQGQIPPPLQHSGKGVDLEHRDARLVIGTFEDGRILIALTRFDALGPSLGRIPLGLTTPEMAAVMGALGCREALMLDGGISGQLAVRDAAGFLRQWPGIRSVPLGLVARPIGAKTALFMYH